MRSVLVALAALLVASPALGWQDVGALPSLRGGEPALLQTQSHEAAEATTKGLPEGVRCFPDRCSDKNDLLVPFLRSGVETAPATMTVSDKFATTTGAAPRKVTSCIKAGDVFQVWQKITVDDVHVADIYYQKLPRAYGVCRRGAQTQAANDHVVGDVIYHSGVTATGEKKYFVKPFGTNRYCFEFGVTSKAGAFVVNKADPTHCWDMCDGTKYGPDNSKCCKGSVNSAKTKCCMGKVESDKDGNEQCVASTTATSTCPASHPDPTAEKMLAGTAAITPGWKWCTKHSLLTSCPSDMHFIPAAGRAKARCVPHCPEGTSAGGDEYWGKLCKPVIKCPEGYTLSRTECVLSSCPAGFKLEGGKCLPNEPFCPAGYSLSTEGDSAHCERICPAGYSRTDINRCEPDSKCSEGFQFIDNHCVHRSCPAGMKRVGDQHYTGCVPQSNLHEYVCADKDAVVVKTGAMCATVQDWVH